MHKYGHETWTDAELLERMLARKGQAWREFHRRYDRLIYRCIHKVTGRFTSVVGSEDVREIYAMFLMNLTARNMHKLRSFQPERGNKLSSWIGLLATNTAWDYLRSVARQPQTTQLADAAEVRTTQASAVDQLMEKEQWRLLNEAILSFSSKDRDFLKLYYVDGLSPEEIAEKMDISVKTVYSKKHKIRCRLERAVNDHPDFAA
ncbi:MAG: sigma-70 family RNA polymerase sigma factor, partial [Myxococcota bacterium]